MVKVDNPGNPATAPPEGYYGKLPAPEMGFPPPPPPQGVPVGQSSIQALQANHTTPGTWSTGLCDCFTDVSNCCITCWCPCVTFGQIAEIVDQGSTSCGASGALYALIAYITGCACIYSCFYRTKMRRQYLLPEHPLPDCIVHFFCESCALCQEYRELQNRGFDVALGWHGNVARQQQNPRMQMAAPLVQGGMMR